MSQNLRPLQFDDRESLVGLLSRIPQFNEDDVALAMELIDIALINENQKDYKFIIAEENTGQIVGYICFGPTPLTDRGFCLYWIGVDPDYSDQGIGSQLIQAMENELLGLHARLIYLETSSAANYELTRRFYLQHGYSLADTFQDFFQVGEDRLTYFKRLST